VNQEKLVDGLYEGSYEAGPNKAVVKVTIKDNKIVSIQIVEHRAWKGKKAEFVIPRIIIERQQQKLTLSVGLQTAVWIFPPPLSLKLYLLEDLLPKTALSRNG